MAEQITLRQIVEREGSCVAVFRKDPAGEVPVRASNSYPPMKKLADRLTAETGVEHMAALVIRMPIS